MLGLGALVYKGLNDATLYFRNADEAVAQRDELGTKRFRLQGTVVGEPVVDGDAVTFDVAYNGVEVAVDHTGTPPDMFRARHPRGARGPLARGRRRVRERPHPHQARRELRVRGRLPAAHRRGRAGRRPRHASDGADGAEPRRGRRVNAALGTAGIVLGVAASIGGVVTLAVALAPAQAPPAAVGPLVRAAGPGGGGPRRGGHGAGPDHPRLHRPVRGRQRQQPHARALYNVATLWAALEGSILLWVLVLTVYMALVVHKFRKRLDDPLVGWAMLVMLVGQRVLLPAAAAARPTRSRRSTRRSASTARARTRCCRTTRSWPCTRRCSTWATSGFTVPFAFAVAALVTGRVGEGWLMETRRWTLFAWGFLTFGIVLGAWWSYEVLNWGGYWGWDPVENASLLPWLTGTAFLHSVMVQERRGMLRVWNLSLVCATFSLTILGTFLTRSGVIASVHAFTEGDIGALAARLLRSHGGGDARPDRLAGRPPAGARAASTRRSRARAPSWPTTCCSRGSPSWCCSAPCSRCWSRRSTTTSCRSAARTSTAWRCRSA